MNDDDPDLIAAIAAGDEAAFERFYRRHVDAVITYGVRRCRDAHEVSELAAAVFLSVWRSAGSFDASRGSASAWLNGIASNRLIDLRRGDQRRDALAARLIERRVLEPDDIDRLTERIDAERSARAVVSAVSDLPDTQREALTMVAIDGLTATEAADRIGTSPTAVRMRLVRARRGVQAALGLDLAAHEDATHQVATHQDETTEVLP